jgi:hypothetical protein
MSVACPGKNDRRGVSSGRQPGSVAVFNFYFFTVFLFFRKSVTAPYLAS